MFNAEDTEEMNMVSKRDLFHSKSALTTIVPGRGELTTPDPKIDARFTPMQHSEVGSGAPVSIENSINKLYDQAEAQRNGQTRAPRVKDLISYAEVRQQSKDRRKQQNAVKNLALNFQKFKNSQDESQQIMRNQMLIVDSIEHEIQRSQNDLKQSYHHEDSSMPSNGHNATKEISQ